MTTLTANVTASTRYWHISAPLAAGVLYLRAQSEVVEVRKAYSVANELATPDPLRIYVRRGVGGTVRASHSSGVTLTATNAFVEGGGGGSIVTVAASDPGAVGAGNFWLKTAQDGFSDLSNFPLFVRNGADNGWLAAGFGEVVNGSMALNTWTTDGHGNAFVDLSTFSDTLSASIGYSDDDGQTTTRMFNGALSVLLKAQEALVINAQGVHLGSDTAPALIVGSLVPGTLSRPIGSLYLSTTDGAVWHKFGSGSSDWALVNPFVQASAISDLAASVSDPPTQTDVQDIADRFDALLASLRTAGLLAL